MNRFYTGEARATAAGEYPADQMAEAAAWQAARRVRSAGVLGALGDLPPPLQLNAARLVRRAAHDIGCCLALILEIAPPGTDVRRRAAQLNTIADLRDALGAFLGETMASDRSGERIDAALTAATEIIGDEWRAIVAEATAIATEGGGGRPN